MKALKYPLCWGLALLFLALTSCQSTDSTVDSATEVTPISEFPVSTSSEAALTEFNLGLEKGYHPDPSEARAHFTKAIELDPEFAGAYLYRAFFTGVSAQEVMADLTEGKKHLAGATEGEKLLAELMTTWTTADLDERMEVAKKMVAEFPKVARSHIVLGNQYLLQKDKDVATARAAFERAVEEQPESYAAHLRIGDSYMYDEPKDYAKAIDHYQRLTELDPDNPRAYTSLGNCYRVQNKLEKALAQYEAAIKVDPESFLPHQLMGHINSFLGNYSEAEKNYQEAARLDSEKKAEPLRYNNYTSLYEGKPAEAMEGMMAHFESMESAGIPTSVLDQRRMSIIDDYNKVAFHTGATEELKEGLSLAKPLMKSVYTAVGTEESMASMKSDMLFWDAIIAIREGDLETASDKADSVKIVMEPINNSNKLNGYHFLLGQIAMEAEDYEQAIQHFSELPDDWVYGQYYLGKAKAAAGNQKAAYDIFQKLVDHNLNGVEYALIRNELIRLTTSS